MARLARREYLDPQTIQIAHITSRCVRRAFLCGQDAYSGKSYEHRREWIRERLEFLASVFAMDCLTFAVMSNHIHLILRSRPDIARQWTDEEVARRWLTLCPPRQNGRVAKPTESDIALITSDARQVAELRIRLSDMSWWVRMTAEKIARQANKEDGCTGRFWEGRFKAQLLLDEAAILACAMYVDLNPIRAAMAESLEASKFTGAKARIDDLMEFDIDLKSVSDKLPKNQTATQRSRSQTRSFNKNSKRKLKQTNRWERSRGRSRSGWLSPLEIREASDPTGGDTSGCGRRASLKGFLSMSLLKYLQLLDWTGRQLRSNKRGSIPAEIQPVLSRVGIESDRWLDLAQDFGRLFKRAAGRTTSLTFEANRRGQCWLQAPGSTCFVT